MDNTDFKKLMERSAKIRERYHELERSNHNTIWSIEEDALAFLTDAGLVGRNIMSEQNRWPKKDTETELPHKIGECFWWLIILSQRMGMSPEALINDFLSKTENHLNIK
ncbi:MULTISPECIES: nucleoside triphosphate pyrophosphohydrolase family protein [Acinetobacter]|uniref:MazG-like protein n=1 Tax=Acinetobacter faecalis TaxID=2665161 RepID=A0AB35UUC8_9GAMM|nr:MULTISPECIES: MazG-like protein [Acinetobacter]MDC5087263.1 MazG-like protein [Acinetobacter baumannii]MDY6485212.1 MazG-like protein [Acinetobacter faecalis]MDY6487391.1 MazG-like protein [Acinetobacter faecalis]MDY6490402.1 MazG-like protein [Acinetobacter faecalis]MDY6537452.1 MazG-like protein [Acinetobacter faecalis]